MYHAEFDTLKKLLDASIKDFQTVDGIKEKSATRLYEALHQSVTNVPLARLVAATQLLGYGVGEKKIQALLDGFPSCFEETHLLQSELIDKIQNDCNGIVKLAERMATNLHHVRTFLKTHPMITVLGKKDDTVSDMEESDDDEEKNTAGLSVKNKVFVFTGFRDKVLENEIVKRGGRVATTISGKTNYLIAKNAEAVKGNKSSKAEANNVEIILLDAFKAML